MKFGQICAGAVLAASLASVGWADEHGHQHQEGDKACCSEAAMKSPGAKALHQGMMKGMHEMHHMKMSGDVDRDFSAMMIHHHEQAIAMSNAVLEHGKNAEVKKKAREIIQASEKDIAELKKHTGDGATHKQ